MSRQTASYEMNTRRAERAAKAKDRKAKRERRRTERNRRHGERVLVVTRFGEHREEADRGD